jgi:hypothetical protein
MSFANSPLGNRLPPSPRRSSIPLWDRGLARQSVRLEERRVEAAETRMVRRATTNLTNLRSHDF